MHAVFIFLRIVFFSQILFYHTDKLNLSYPCYIIDMCSILSKERNSQRVLLTVTVDFYEVSKEESREKKPLVFLTK